MRSALLVLVALAPAVGCGGTTGTEARAPAPNRPAPPAIGIRLPDDARPLAYRVTLELDPARDNIAGHGEIDLERRSGERTRGKWIYQ